MLYLLIRAHYDWLHAHRLGFLRVFTDVTFQSTAAVILSFVIVLALGPPVIAWLRRQKIGDEPNFDQDQLNELMHGKRGTPTMGGVLIIFAIAISTLLLADLGNFYVRMALVCLIWLGAVGVADDWLKLTTLRRAAKLPPGTQVSRQGLTSLEKLLFQVGLAIVLGIFTYNYGLHVKESHTLYVPIFKQFSMELGVGTFVMIVVLVLTGTSNAVNLTDGLDGLAAGTSAIVSATMLILALIQEAPTPGVQSLAEHLHLPLIIASDKMAVVAGSMFGACLGFLWFNCSPAAVFMGDTGSLALGGLLGYIAIVLRQELLLAICGGIFVAEALSVMLQVSWFKYTRIRFGEGRRIFLMSPLHHHFQRMGWSETKVVVRFWLISAILAMLALATIKVR